MSYEGDPYDAAVDLVKFVLVIAFLLYGVGGC